MKPLIFLFAILILCSCSTQKIEKQIIGMWVIENVVIDHINYKNGKNILFLNTFFLDENNKCRLPARLNSVGEEEGIWHVIEKDGVYYLKIENCNDIFYNDEYRIDFKNGKKAIFTSKKYNLNVFKLLFISER